jgi:glycosyltransferase involved in cell wall biosynthesis
MFITKDEEELLPEALASVSFADEILVIDSGSTDRTREVAQQFGARVVRNEPWPGFAAQRNVGFDTARHDLVLFLDADERVSPTLHAEIEALRASKEPLKAGYRIARVAHYMGRWIRGTDWYPDWQLRLFDRAHVVGDVPVRMVEDLAFQPAHFAPHLHRLVDQRRQAAAEAAIEQA